jgi:hypothetical protein
MAEIQRRQAEVQKLQAAELDAVRERTLAHEKWSNDFRERLNEIGDRLDGLICYVDRLPKQPPPPQ